MQEKKDMRDEQHAVRLDPKRLTGFDQMVDSSSLERAGELLNKVGEQPPPGADNSSLERVGQLLNKVGELPPP